MKKQLAFFILMLAMTVNAAILVNTTITPVTPKMGEDGYYSINNVEELYGFAQLVNHYREDDYINARLEADITINEGLFDGVEMTDSTFPQPLCVQNGDSCAFEEWEPIGLYNSHYYYGHFDGQGHTVRGVFINRPTWDSIGFFGKAGGIIENLNIADSYISGGEYGVGGILGAGRGHIYSCSFSGAVEGENGVGGIGGTRGGQTINCRNDGYVRAHGTGYNARAGGIVGSLIYVVDKCVNTGTVFSSITAGGIVGNNDGHVKRSYNLGSVYGKKSAGGIVGENDDFFSNDTLTNCLNLGPVKGEKRVGAIIGTDSGYTANSYALKGTAEELSDITESESVEFVDKESLTDGSLLKKLNSTSMPFVQDWEQGESHPVLKDIKPKFKDGVYEIENEEQFMWFVEHINECKPTMGNLKFALVNDLVFNKNVQSSECVQKDSICDFVEWTPIRGSTNGYAGFHGEFDGRFHTISGLYSSKNSGLFSFISKYGKVKDLILLDSYLSGNMPGSIVEFHSGQIMDCFSDAILNEERTYRLSGGRGPVANLENRNGYAETRSMNKDLWFDGKNLLPYHKKICEYVDKTDCNLPTEFQSTLDYTSEYRWHSFVTFPYQPKPIEKEQIYPYKKWRYPAETSMDSLGYLSFKYRMKYDSTNVRVGFWFREDTVSASFDLDPSYGIDISDAKGICATYTSDQDVFLNIERYHSDDTTVCSIMLPKSKKISTVQTSFKDYQFSQHGNDSISANCSSVIAHAQAMWFEMSSFNAKEGTVRIFEFGPKGTCKGNKKIAKEPEEYCYAGHYKTETTADLCEANLKVPEQAYSISSEMGVTLIGKTLLFSGVSSNAVFRVVDLKGNVVKTGLALPMVDLSAVKTGVYAIVVRDGARKLVKKVPLW